MERILIIGAAGQIGSDLLPGLREKYGAERVVAAVHRRSLPEEAARSGPWVRLDCLDRSALKAVLKRFDIGLIYHLAARLSASAEADPFSAWRENMDGLQNVLELAWEHRCRVFFPSSIGAFGGGSPRQETPQTTIMRPSTIYGISKVAGELLGDYAHHRFGLDCRGLRYPGIISHKTAPGGGTTDYAVAMFHAALAGEVFDCCLAPHTTLDMMYMPDAVRAAMELMEADACRLTHRNAYNVTGFSINPVQLLYAIRRFLPDFELEYRVDPLRQSIADSWPEAMDDTQARQDWGWKPQYDLDRTTADMVANLGRCGAA